MVVVAKDADHLTDVYIYQDASAGRRFAFKGAATPLRTPICKWKRRIDIQLDARDKQVTI